MSIPSGNLHILRAGKDYTQILEEWFEFPCRMPVFYILGVSHITLKNNYIYVQAASEMLMSHPFQNLNIWPNIVHATVGYSLVFASLLSYLHRLGILAIKSD